MLIDHVLVRWRVLALVVASLAAGCTKPNPRSCLDGTCTDPAFPFCDVDGALEGQPNTCIAVECTPLEFAGCRGDLAITCNTAGTDFELVQCERGCEEGTGCRLCDPNETACTNGTVATCDAAGTVVSSQPCPLGCFEDEPRCRDIDPSNGLALFLDGAQVAADVALSNVTIFTDTGEIRDAGNNLLDVPSTLLAAPAGGAPIRVIVADTIQLGGTIRVTTATAGFEVSGPALAFVANGDVELAGELTFWTDDYRDIGTAGGVDIVGCSGEFGFLSLDTDPSSQDLFSGSGGGGHATAGGAGGGIEFRLSGGRAGAAAGNATLVPLRGGCAGGGYGGGGAVQISSRTRIRLAPGATINTNGLNGGIDGMGPAPTYGPGAGGGILLEAPEVVLEAGARLLANGGASPAGDGTPGISSETTSVSAGGTCVGSPSLRCSNGGNGAAVGGPASAGGEVAYTTTASITTFRAGAGGGGLGFIRVNTAMGSHTIATDVIESGSLSEGVIRTR